MDRRRIADYVPLVLAMLLFVVSMGFVLDGAGARPGGPASSIGSGATR